MRTISIEKVTLNVGTGKSQETLERAMKLLELITGKVPVKNITKKRIQGWGVRPGLPIGCKITLRGSEAKEVLQRLLEARDNKLGDSNFDENGNVSFGLTDYIDVPGLKYNPDIGSLGLQACITLKRPGYRVKQRKVRKSSLPRNHVVNHEESIAFMKENFKTIVGGEA